MRLASILPQRLAPRIQLVLLFALLAVGAGSSVLLYSLHRRHLLTELRAATATHGALLEQGLRHAMVDRDPQLLATLVRRLGEEPAVTEVLVLDRRGEVRFASDPAQLGSRPLPADRACLECHGPAPDEAALTEIRRRADGQRVLRSMNPIRNGPECVACHAPADPVNGYLVIDHDLEPIESQLHAQALTFAGGILVALAVLGAVLGGLLHRLVLRPVSRLRRALAAAEDGHLGIELPTRGSDEMADLSTQFNRMAANLRDTLAQLREREQYLGRILASADDGIVVVDRNLCVVTANEAYLELCGKEMDEVVGRTCCLAPQCRRDEIDHCPSWVAFEQRESHQIVRRITDDKGRTRTYEISASPLEIDGTVSQTLEVWRDITERTRLEAELAHSERLASVGLLASGISHEINNPLATITTCLDGLQRRLDEPAIENGPGSEVVRHYLELISREVQRCRDLTRKLVLLSQKSSPIREPMDLNAVIMETISLLAFEIENRHARVDCDLAPDLPPVCGDEARLRQVMLNLLLNALEAIDDRGAVRIESRWAGEGVQITIADNGCGIAAADLEHVFEPFYSVRRHRRGTGLGLFISNQIVRAHGGTIEIRSHPGAGTTIHVQLPLHGRPADEGPDLRSPGR